MPSDEDRALGVIDMEVIEPFVDRESALEQIVKVDPLVKTAFSGI